MLHEEPAPGLGRGWSSVRWTQSTEKNVPPSHRSDGFVSVLAENHMGRVGYRVVQTSEFGDAECPSQGVPVRGSLEGL